MKNSEFQIEIDDVYACPGTCPGCVLSKNERKTRIPDMTQEVRRLVFQRLQEYTPTLEHLESINLAYGIADHLLMPIKYLEEIVGDASRYLKSMNTLLKTSGLVFMSMSLIGKESSVKKQLDALFKVSQKMNQPIVPLVVLDPIKLKHPSFKDPYQKNIKYSLTTFGRVDLSLNLSLPVIKEFTPDDIAQFAKENHFEEVTINWSPTLENLENTFSLNEKLALEKWLLEFWKLTERLEISTSFPPVVQKIKEAYACASDAEPHEHSGIQIQVLSKMLNDTLTKSIQFNHEGVLYPKFEAVGDAPHNTKFGFKDWCNIEHYQSLGLQIKKGVSESLRQIVKVINQSAPCRSCKYSMYCANTGFHIYTQSTRLAREGQASSNQCPHVAYALWEGPCE